MHHHILSGLIAATLVIHPAVAQVISGTPGAPQAPDNSRLCFMFPVGSTWYALQKSDAGYNEGSMFVALAYMQGATISFHADTGTVSNCSGFWAATKIKFGPP